MLRELRIDEVLIENQYLKEQNQDLKLENDFLQRQLNKLLKAGE